MKLLYFDFKILMQAINFNIKVRENGWYGNSLKIMKDIKSLCLQNKRQMGNIKII